MITHSLRPLTLSIFVAAAALFPAGPPAAAQHKAETIRRDGAARAAAVREENEQRTIEQLDY